MEVEWIGGWMDGWMEGSLCVRLGAFVRIGVQWFIEGGNKACV